MTTLRWLLFIVYTVVLILHLEAPLFSQEATNGREQSSEDIKEVTITAALSAYSAGTRTGISSESEEPNSNGRKRKKFNLQPVYPNPVATTCYLFIDWYEVEAKATAELKIYNLEGTSMKDITALMKAGTGEIGTRVEIPVEDLPNGMYLVVLSSAEALVRSRPLIVIR